MKTLNQHIVKSLIKSREASSHKGTYGHCLLVAGNIGRMGAAVITSRACLRSGTYITLKTQSMENMLIMDVIENLGLAFKEISDL